MYCSSCGKTIPDSSAYCQYCGVQIDNKASGLTSGSASIKSSDTGWRTIVWVFIMLGLLFLIFALMEPDGFYLANGAMKVSPILLLLIALPILGFVILIVAALKYLAKR